MDLRVNWDGLIVLDRVYDYLCIFVVLLRAPRKVKIILCVYGVKRTNGICMRLLSRTLELISHPKAGRKDQESLRSSSGMSISVHFHAKLKAGYISCCSTSHGLMSLSTYVHRLAAVTAIYFRLTLLP